MSVCTHVCVVADGDCGTEVSVKELDWDSSSDGIISTYTNSQPLDCIIATGPV